MGHFFSLILKAILVQSMSKPFSKERYVYLALSTNYTRTCRVSFGRHGKLSKATNEDFTSKCWAKYIRPISTAQMVGVKAMDRHLLRLWHHWECCPFLLYSRVCLFLLLLLLSLFICLLKSFIWKFCGALSNLETKN